MTDALALLALLIAVAAVGVLVVRACGLPLGHGWTPTVLALCVPVGLLVTGGVATLTAAMRVGADVAVVLPASVAVALGTFLRRRRHPPAPWVVLPTSQRQAARALEFGALAAFALVSFRTMRTLVVTPLGGWDGWAIWGLHARALYEQGDLWAPVFRDPVYAEHHSEYPVLTPALQALASDAIGRFDTELIHVIPGVFLIAGALATWGVLRTLIPPWLAAVVALAVLGSEPLFANAAANYADAALALVVAAGVLLLAVWVERSSSAALALGSIFLGAAGLIKAEGLVLGGAALFALVVALFGTGRIRNRQLLRAWAGICAPAIVWNVFVGVRGPRAEAYDYGALLNPDYLADEGFRVVRALDRMVEALFLDWGFSILLLLALGVLAIAVGAYRMTAFLTAWLVASWAGLVIAYLVSNLEIQAHLVTSVRRVVFGAGLTILVVAPLIAATSWERARVLEHEVVTTGQRRADRPGTA
ncbi:MAG: hypothetical protein ACR2HI_05855 [Gaiella sp.]